METGNWRCQFRDEGFQLGSSGWLNEDDFMERKGVRGEGEEK